MSSYRTPKVITKVEGKTVYVTMTARGFGMTDGQLRARAAHAWIRHYGRWTPPVSTSMTLDRKTLIVRFR